MEPHAAELVPAGSLGPTKGTSVSCVAVLLPTYLPLLLVTEVERPRREWVGPSPRYPTMVASPRPGLTLLTTT